jgi:hypothetical protein
MMEKWRVVPKSKGQYEISTLGRVRNAYTGRILKQFKFRNGSYGVQLAGYLGRTYTIGQLMATTFYPDESGRACHINGDVKDNRVENIEVRSIE